MAAMLVDTLKQLFAAFIASRTERPERQASRQRLPKPESTGHDEEIELRRDLARWPASAEAHIRLGALLESTGRVAEAEALFRRAIHLHGDNVLAHYNLAIVLGQTDRPLEAEAELRHALKLLPGFADAHHHLGIVLLGADRIPEAELAIRRALELKPTLAGAAQNLNMVLERKDHLAADEADCRGRIVSRPDSAEAHAALGSLLVKAGRMSEAEAAFRRAIDLNPHQAEAHCALANVLVHTQRPWQAEAEYRLALQEKEDFAEALHKLGLVLAATCRLREAADAIARALQREPTSAQAHNDLGLILVQQRRLPEAEAAFRRGLTIAPGHEASHMNLALLLREIESLSSAEEACRRAAKLAPDRAMLQYRLGLVLLSLGRPSEAAASFKRVLEYQQDHARAHNALGRAAMMEGRTEESIACHMRALSSKPDFADAMMHLGTAYLEKLDFHEAARWNEAALAIDPGNTQANRNMGLVLLKSGSMDEANRHLALASGRPAVYVEHAATRKRTVLLLWASNTGNVPTVELLVPLTVNTRVNWVVQSSRDDRADDLPHYDLVFNAAGDPDMIRDATEPLTRFASTSETPLLNPPDKVARTARNNLPALFQEIDNIVVPPVWRISSEADWDESLAKRLPILVRPVDSHGGRDLELVRTAAELARVRASQSGPVFVTGYVDYRSADSWFRKYRVIYVDRQPFPYHLAISQNWLVHYYTADMEAHGWKLEEEKRFLEDPDAVFGRAGMQALRTIGARMDLDYCGIDFSVLPDGRILVFEANPMMLVHPEDISGPIAHKNDHVFRIQAAFERLLMQFSR